MKKLFKGVNRRAYGAAAVTAALLVPLGVFGAPALAGSAGSSAQYQYRVTICHHTHSKKHPTHTITVSSAAVKAHLNHGDTLGACPATVTTTATTHGQSGVQHGKSGESHGKGK